MSGLFAFWVLGCSGCRLVAVCFCFMLQVVLGLRGFGALWRFGAGTAFFLERGRSKDAPQGSLEGLPKGRGYTSRLLGVSPILQHLL